MCSFATAGEDIPLGAVLRPSTSADRQVVQTTSDDDITVIGVASEAASSGDSVCMAAGGEFRVLVTGAVTRGDALASAAASTGAARSVGTPSDSGAFAIAMNSDADAGVKLVYARYVKAETY